MDTNHTQRPSRKVIAAILLGLLVSLLTIWLAIEGFYLGKTRIGATAEITEVSSGITFNARVDTGAAISSVHCEQIIIENAADNPHENLGKLVRALISNGEGDQGWISTIIVDYAKIRSIDAVTSRYYVRLLLRFRGMEKETLVTLNDRGHMRRKLLLGRDFLGSDFVVDVSKNSDMFR